MKTITVPRIVFLALCIVCVLLSGFIVWDKLTEQQAPETPPVTETPAPATPEPTPAPISTPEPAPVTERVWTTSDVNLRKAPGTDGEVITAVKMGEELQRIEIVDNGWSKILYEDDTVCYVSSEFLTDQNPDPPQFVDTAVVGSIWTTDDVNLRRTADKNGEVIALVPKGQELQRVGLVSTGWSRVLYEDDIICYINNDYVSTTPVSADDSEADFTVNECSDVVWTVDSTNLRKGPGTEYDRVTTVDPNVELQRTGTTDNGWSRILLYDKEYYASNDFLTTVKPAETEASEE